jgi:histidinol dehydrogenase
MRCERLTLESEGDATELAAQIRALVPAPAEVSPAVAEIIEAVRTGGDRALGEYTRRFDTAGAEPHALVVTGAELDAAAEQLSEAVRDGLTTAIGNVRRVSEASLRPPAVVTFKDHEVAVREASVARAAVYVPGGRAPYPSTVVMGVVPATVAGVEQIAVCAPPGAGGGIDPVVLGACKLAGATEVYRMGGAQAIAALAYGTESVRPVEVIVGPGNLYVQEAKRQVFGQVGIDGFAGPSDLMVIADWDTDTRPLALDLLAQAEHGPGTLVVGVYGADDVGEAFAHALDDADETGAIAVLVKVPDPAKGVELAEAFAPEHLELIGPHAEALAPNVTRAGCVFVGPNAGTAFGDYIAGSNHILPTNGAARYASAVTANTFRRALTEVRIAHATMLARAAVPVARAEGFELHARSMEARIRDNH